MTVVTDEQIRQIADDLLGTCGTLDGALLAATGTDDFMLLPMRQLEMLDALVMQCACCGWWVDADDVDYEQQCLDCQEE